MFFIGKVIQILRWKLDRIYLLFMRCIDLKDTRLMKSSTFTRCHLISESSIMFQITRWAKEKTLEQGVYLTSAWILLMLRPWRSCVEFSSSRKHELITSKP